LDGRALAHCGHAYRPALRRGGLPGRTGAARCRAVVVLVETGVRTAGNDSEHSAAAAGTRVGCARVMDATSGKRRWFRAGTVVRRRPPGVAVPGAHAYAYVGLALGSAAGGTGLYRRRRGDRVAGHTLYISGSIVVLTPTSVCLACPADSAIHLLFSPPGTSIPGRSLGRT